MSGFEVSDVLVGADPGAGDVDVLAGFSSVWGRASVGFSECAVRLDRAAGVLGGLVSEAVSSLRVQLDSRAKVARDVAAQADVVRGALTRYARDVGDVQSQVAGLRVRVRDDLAVVSSALTSLRFEAPQGSYRLSGGSRWDDVPQLVEDNRVDQVSGVAQLSGSGVREWARVQCVNAVSRWRDAVVRLRGWQYQYTSAMDDRNDANVRFMKALSGLGAVQQIGQFGVGPASVAVAALFSGGAGTSEAVALWQILSTMTGNPGAVAAYWVTLSPGQQQALIDAHYEAIGGMTGVPYAGRDKANRKFLDDEIRFAVPDSEEYRDLVKIRNALKGDGTVRQLISLKTSVVPPLAAISVGNLDTATTATYLIPGMNQTTSSMDNWTRAAQNLYNEQGLANKLGSYAVVAWMGYDTPGPATVGQGDAAANGSMLLNAALTDYNATRGVDSTKLNVVGFSYGTTTASDALASQDNHVDSFVMVGSAGVEKAISNVADLNAGSVYAGQARNVNELPPYNFVPKSGDEWAWIGRSISGRQDPMDSSFGATRIGTDDYSAATNPDLKPVTEHAGISTDGGTGYFDVNSESLSNIAGATTGGQVTAPKSYSPGVISW